MLLYWLWLANRPNVSDGVKCALIRQFSDPQDVYFASQEELAKVPGMTSQAMESLKGRDLEDAEKILADCAKLDISVLTMTDPLYPNRLRSIYDAPVVLYYRGSLPQMDDLATVGVVGTRKPSFYGLQMARRMGSSLARGGALVVSGLAKGIDGAAMIGALNEGVAAVGVLGCGADVVYPKSNKELFLQTECQGCILTEYAPGTPPMSWNFPRRNRIISGLSCGVVVVEAPEKSGALLTARMALDQGRDVFVIPGNVDMPGFVGSNRLLRDGAIAVSTGEDVLLEYEGIYPGKLPKTCGAGLEIPKIEPPKPRQKAKKEPVQKKTDTKTIDKADRQPYSDLKDPAAGLTPEEQQVYAAIGEERLVDEVIAQVGLNPGKVLSILTMLEIKEKICRLPGKRVAQKRG